MANPVLFASSVSAAFVHVLALLWFQPSHPVLAATMACGLVSSIWNHGVTSSAAKYTDRAMMWVGFCTDGYLVWSISHHPRGTLCTVSLVSSALLYWVAKLWGTWKTTSRVAHLSSSTLKPVRAPQLRHGNLPHLTAHLTLTMTHLLLMSVFADSLTN